MSNNYKPLPHYTMAQGVKISKRTNRPTNISLDDPASYVMTDLRDITPFSIEETASIDATNAKMIACGVRLLFVTDNDGVVLGLVTATDVLGEKPVQYVTEHGGKREDIMAKDIMTAQDKLDVLYMCDIEKSSVGHIVETMKMFRRQHVLVVENNQDGQQIIRGIISTSQISRQLGVPVESSIRADSFADLEKALVASF